MNESGVSGTPYLQVADLVKRNDATTLFSGGSSVVVDSVNDGPCASGFATGVALYVSSSQTLNPTADISVLTSYRLTQVNAVSTLVAKDGSAGGRAYTLDVDSVNGVRWYINGGGGTDLITEARAPLVGDDRQALGVYTTTNLTPTMDLYINGRIAAPTLTTPQTSIPIATAQLTFGYRQFTGFNDYFIGGYLRYIYIWNRAITPAEAQWLHAEPFAMLSPETTQRSYWFYFPQSQPAGFLLVKN